MRVSIVIATLIGASVVTAASTGLAHSQHLARRGWSKDELSMLRSLSLSSLGPLPKDPSNRVADDTAAANLGHRLFFDARLSSNGQVACATCHMPDKDFQDGRPVGIGVGTAGRRTMPIAGTAYSPWQFWDGRSDSQWSQALGPLESSAEHGGDRLQYAHAIAANYKEDYERVFGRLPPLADLTSHAGPVADTSRARAWTRIAPARQADISRVYANIGKAIAAYERTIQFTPSRFDRYVDAELASRPHTPNDAFSDDEKSGLRLFIDKANCTNCHNGALLTDNHFHNTGVPQSASGARSDSGRAAGARQVVTGEFNCTGRYSDAKSDDCQELRFAVIEGPELLRAFKTPTLRNVVGRAPYMHAGQYATIEAVLAHYNGAPASPFGKSELKPLHLSAAELEQLARFLQTLSSPLVAPPGYLSSPAR